MQTSRGAVSEVQQTTISRVSLNPNVYVANVGSDQVASFTGKPVKVLIKDIDAGKHEELLARMTNDKHKVVIDALGAMCDLIEAQNASNLPNDGIIYSIDDVAALFGVPFNSLKEIDVITKDLEVSKYDLWSKLTKETCRGIIDIIYNRWDTFLNMQKSAPVVDNSLSSKASPSDPNVQSVDINTKSTSYAGAAGANAKDKPKVNSNFRPLVVDPVIDGVNISIPRKGVEKVSTRFEHTLYG
nr:zinc knuckle CX2CX4HX4C [Tanacetum cinerariifolium]